MSQIRLGSSNLELTMQIPNTETATDFINQFGRLWIGQIQPAIFKSAFNDLKGKVLPWLVDLAALEDDDNYRIGHKLDLCHQALQSHWRLPGTASIVINDFFWESGLSRILAGGLAWSDAWQQHRLLLLSNHPAYADRYLCNYTEIVNETELVSALGGPGHKISTRISVNKQYEISLRLGAIQEQVESTRSYLMDLPQRVDTLREWIRLYPKGSRLDVYTDYPENIVDSVGFWNIHHAGPSPKFSTASNIDSELYKLSTQRPAGSHEFYVQERTGEIDVAELLFWQDLKYTSFATRDWQCVLRRPNQVHYTKTIGLSQL